MYNLPKFGQEAALIKTMLPHWFISSTICAGMPGEGDGACHGDSGGPLAKFTDNPHPHFNQIGYSIMFPFLSK